LRLAFAAAALSPLPPFAAGLLFSTAVSTDAIRFSSFFLMLPPLDNDGGRGSSSSGRSAHLGCLHEILARCFACLRRTYTEPCNIESWKKEHRQQRGAGEPADDRIGHWPPEHVVHDGYHAEDRSRRGQHDRPQPVIGCFHDGVPCRHAGAPIMLDLVD